MGGTVAGGGVTNSAELYDPASDSWTIVGAMNAARSGHSATRTTDGRVLIAGGGAVTLEIYDPLIRSFLLLPALLSSPRSGHAAALLPNGGVLLAGGSSGTTALATAELVDVSAETVSSAPDLAGSNATPSAAVLRDGRVLMAGSSPQVYNPLGSAAVAASYPRTISFSGETWHVKRHTTSKVGPGPNLFSDSTSNVWVDTQGRLHMKITKVGGKWYCAEVISARSFGHGTYRFYLDTPVDQLDPTVVLGLFTWNDDPAFYNRELDVEFARWGDKNNQNAQYVVQPHTIPQNIYRFQQPPNLAQTTHSFLWRPDSVQFQSLNGHPPNPTAVINEKLFPSGIPPAGGENARINLWLFRGRAPTDRKEVEIIVKQFEFLP